MALRRTVQPWLRLNTLLTQQQYQPMSACLFSSKADEPPQQKAEAPAKPDTDTASTSAGTSVATSANRPKAAEEWTEVIDEKSGQTYYWNEKTGETTDLGEPKPKTRFRDQEWEQAANSGPFQEGWREPPGRDHTYFYSVLGVGIGIAAGWFTQYLH